MDFLYPVDATALQFKFRLDNTLINVGLAHLIPVATASKCRLMARAMVLQELRGWMRWYEFEARKRTLSKHFGTFPREFLEHGHVSGAMTRLFPNDEHLHPEFHAILTDEVMDPTYCAINQVFTKLFGDSTWDVCLIKPLGENLLVERKGDYRVWDWSNTNGHICHPWNPSN
ncbi:hypothetical protein D3C71_536010 [compost metagenome]